MILKNHYIELFINGVKADIKSQESLGIRLSATLQDPTKITSVDGEYSYTFSIPSTPNNDKILDYANNLSKINKFHSRYSAKVYADGNLIFDGSLTITKYDANSREYNCNLVQIKVLTFEDLFGEDTLSMIPWEVDFQGNQTINQVNRDLSTKYYFPLVSYGVFQKKPYFSDEVANEYTSKFDIDKYNKWWVESFFPSINMLEHIKRAFEWKGVTVAGNVFDDPILSNIYQSVSISSEQKPVYNIGNPLFGRMHVKVSWNNHHTVAETPGRTTSTTGRINGGSGTTQYLQDLQLPYEALGAGSETEYNFDSINVYNVLQTKDSKGNAVPGVTVTMLQNTYMYEPGESLIVIPADGFYRINLRVTNATLQGAGGTWIAQQKKASFGTTVEINDALMTLKKDFKRQTPFELHLVRNYDDNIELIKGKKNWYWHNGDPNDATYRYQGNGFTGTSYTNLEEWETEYPHEKLYGSKSPTKIELKDSTMDTSGRQGGWDGTSTGATGSTGGGTWGGGRRNAPAAPSSPTRAASTDEGNYTNSTSLGYFHKVGTVMPYEQGVSSAFICGFSTMGEGQFAVMRNGKSIYRTVGIKNESFYTQPGLYNMERVDNAGNYQAKDTQFGKNEYRYSNNYITVTSSNMSGSIECCVKLNKNDVLELMAVTRAFESLSFYGVSADIELDIEAISDRTYYQLSNDPTFNYYSPTDFPYNLNLSNFCSDEKKIADWIEDVKNAFNLSIKMEGDTVTIDKSPSSYIQRHTVVDINDRVNPSTIESSIIEYPKEMSVQYTINTQEYGYETTVPQDKINLSNWMDFGDSGYSVVQLNDDSYVTATQNLKVPFSYTWYTNFRQLNADDNLITNLYIPVIEESQYMAEGVNYDDAMSHDGYSMTPRFWFRQGIDSSAQPIRTNDYMNGEIYFTLPTNQYMGVNLSYKNTETSLLTEYFNIEAKLASNYITVNTYLNPIEYDLIKKGALIYIDSDLYIPIRIDSYDPTANNQSKLTLMKKV